MKPLLEQEVAAAVVIDPGAALLEPGVVAIELGAEPGVHPGQAVLPGLVDVHMEHPMVDALRQRPVAAPLERPGRALEQHPAGKGLCMDNGLPVGVGGGRGAPQFDTAQVSRGPEFPAQLVRLPSVLQKLRRIAPMAVILQPDPQPVPVAGVAQPAHVIIRHAVRYQPPQVPQESVRLLGAADEPAREHGQPRARVIAVVLQKELGETVRPILRAHLVAVGHHVFECLALGRRHPLEELADIGVKMGLRGGAVHLVHFQPLAFGRSGGVARACWRHAGAEDDPFPGGHIPGEGAVARELITEIQHPFGRDGEGCGFGLSRFGPQVGIPHGLRRGVHLGKLFLDVALKPRRARQLDLRQPARAPQVGDDEPEALASLGREGYGNRRVG